MNGSIAPPQEGVLTDGLSVGPGTQPQGAVETEQPLMQTLRQVAVQARSPVLRALARDELRRLTRQAKL